MSTPTRDSLRRSDVQRRRSGRQALAVIPDMTSIAGSPGEAISVEVNAMDNVINSRHGIDSWSPALSPDELVIQKRGRRRKTIVWSPDVDACKRDSLFSLSSRDRTPVKSPRKSTLLRNTPRKRLLLGDSAESQLATPEKRKPTSECQTSVGNDSSSQKQFNRNLVKGLRGLSHEQLVKMIMDLVSMQEDGLLTNEKLRDVLLNMMPIADIHPLRERLNILRQNIHTTVGSSDLDEPCYGRAYIHLDAYQKSVTEQGTTLLESEHWTAVMQYVFAAWNITKDLPQWEYQGSDDTSRRCFKILAEFCMEALKSGTFVTSTLDAYHKKLETMIADCEDLTVCLKLIKDAKRGDH
ncbi:uncharacterized protein LOC105698707 [Orussus abietinus]|uniref:uncharacterized protein LOC105698707 n=1 Tax=Orussus abietinus TaxID=222816 RepID=UPI0006269125|nr:uncharacterized protein LOC105698707 [Orussus abietinus]XP_012278600.1 uncharacterized protein LOC105698707 [Orussus abietinus]